MRKFITFFVIGSAVLLSNSCKNDLDALAPYVESVAIYGLLDQNDSVNYIRVNRVFLGQGDANQIAQIQDSVYFKPDEASVIVEKYWNGIKKQTYVFSETYEVPLQPGVFNTNQLIYKSTQKFRSDSAGKYFDYKLVVKNNLSGKEYTATTRLIKDVSPGNTSGVCSAVLGQNCFFNQGNISILSNINAKTSVKFLSPANSAICGFKLKFHYTSIYSDNSTANKIMELKFDNQNTSSTAGGEVMDFTFSGPKFYGALSTGIPAETNIFERVADSISFVFSFGGLEYQQYREINNTSGSFGQEKPIYTNISNDGVGVFSSKTSITVVKKMFDCTGGPNQNNVISSATLTNITTGTTTCNLLIRGPHCSQNTGC